jgi:hypothetical protein
MNRIKDRLPPGVNGRAHVPRTAAELWEWLGASPQECWGFDRRGGWTPAREFLPRWSDDPSEDMDRGERAGWGFAGALGLRDSACWVEVYAEGGSPRSLAVVWLFGEALQVVCEDRPALLKLLALVSPLVGEARAAMNE